MPCICINLDSRWRRASHLVFTLFQPLLLIVFVYVAVLALSLSVHYFVRVFALSGTGPTAIPVVTVVAHALGEVLQVLMVACKDLSGLSARFYGPFNRGLRLLRGVGKPLFLILGF